MDSVRIYLNGGRIENWMFVIGMIIGRVYTAITAFNRRLSYRIPNKSQSIHYPLLPFPTFHLCASDSVSLCIQKLYHMEIHKMHNFQSGQLRQCRKKIWRKGKPVKLVFKKTVEVMNMTQEWQLSHSQTPEGTRSNRGNLLVSGYIDISKIRLPVWDHEIQGRWITLQWHKYFMWTTNIWADFKTSENSVAPKHIYNI